MADTSDIASALIAKLGSDAELLSLCPNGVYWDEAPPGSTRFVIVAFINAIDRGVFGRRAIEEGIYLVEARMLSTVQGANIKRAAARIDELLEDQPLTVAGYTWSTMHRLEPVRMTEVDEVDPSIRWNRRGGQYFIEMSHTDA
jgi:hypothetical protein